MTITVRPRLLASAVALCFTVPAAVAQSAADQSLAPVVITGARFDAEPSLAPVGATVITADEIRRSGAADVNTAIRKIGGVYGRQSLDGSPDFTLDLRGFGANSSQNMVVVLDGVRLSENELRNPVLSSIPVDSVERIEITRGGASVLYGDGATGGVINIVSKRPDQRAGSGSVFLEGGSFHAGEARVSAAQSWAGFAADATLGHQRTDNYRDNNEFRQTQFNGGLQWYNEAGRVGVRYEGARQDSRLPGSLSEAQYNANPRQTLSPQDNGSLDSDRLTAFGQYRVAGHDVAAELSYRKRTIDSLYVSSFGPSAASYDSKQWQFSPRVRKLGAVRGMINELVVGADFTKWQRDTHAGYSLADAEQKSKALYLRDELRFDPVHEGRIAVGARRELFDKNFRDPLGFPTDGYDVTQGLNAWEVQLSYMPVRGLTVFGKAGQSYRLPNADENAFTPFANDVLRPQKSKDVELGATYANAGAKLTARTFRSRLTDEIYYDPTAGAFGANANLDPTRRQGFELDGEQRIAADWRVSAHYQYVDAKFRAGANRGKQIALVPENTVTARLSWTPASGQSADVGVQWVDDQRYGDDFANSCAAKIPSYTTVDGRYARRFGQWELALAGTNLADKHYYSQAFQCRGGIYPADGRQWKLSARYDF